MVPPPPGEESQTVVLPPGWQSYLSPQGRRYYVNTATNGESRSGQRPAPVPGSCPSGGVVLSSLLHLLGFRLFFPKSTSEAAGESCLLHRAGWQGAEPGWGKMPFKVGVILGTSQPPGIFVEPSLMVWGCVFQTEIARGSAVHSWFKSNQTGYAAA